MAAGFINASVTEKHRDKMVCIKRIQLLLFASKSLIRVPCFHVLPFVCGRDKVDRLWFQMEQGK